MGQIATVLPEAKLKIDPMKTVDWIAKTMAIDPSILREDSQVQLLIQQMQKMAQTQQGMQVAESGAKIAKDAGTAEKHLAHAESLRGGE